VGWFVHRTLPEKFQSGLVDPDQDFDRDHDRDENFSIRVDEKISIKVR